MFGRLLAAPTRLPSTDLYFRNACAEWIAPQGAARLLPRGLFRRRPAPPIAARSANCFTHGEAMVLIRKDRPEVVAEALAWRGRLAYMIDDDIAAALASEGLPERYRAKLARIDSEVHRPLLARADLVLVPSAELAARLAGETRGEVRQIDPCWAAPFADQAHFASLAEGGTLRIAHLGSGSHATALATLAPAVLAMLEAEPLAHFTYVAARAIDPTLETHPRARRIEPKPWDEYRRWLPRQRFHLALYPLLREGFDRARSINKLAEHAIVGAAGLYPADWAPADRLGAGALRAPAQPGEWGAALHRAVAERGALAAAAAAAAQALADLQLAAQQRDLWRRFLGIAA
jgi:hypothetical protein